MVVVVVVNVIVVGVGVCVCVVACDLLAICYGQKTTQTDRGEKKTAFAPA